MAQLAQAIARVDAPPVADTVPAVPARLDAQWVASGLRTRVLAPLGVALLLLVIALVLLIVGGRNKSTEREIA